MKHLLTFIVALMIIVISGWGAATAKEAVAPANESSTPADWLFDLNTAQLKGV
ncbi:hypothetical protein [Paenibacillus tyrfis]|uniref:hypothetical protein n=1 Tax=Paenibacillus tyrfis TaxID=1501230 RepID=UPI001378DAAE|nr:hypothetical protein [Paenibacillus tyrfis]